MKVIFIAIHHHFPRHFFISSTTSPNNFLLNTRQGGNQPRRVSLSLLMLSTLTRQRWNQPWCGSSRWRLDAIQTVFVKYSTHLSIPSFQIFDPSEYSFFSILSSFKSRNGFWLFIFWISGPRNLISLTHLSLITYVWQLTILTSDNLVTWHLKIQIV